MLNHSLMVTILTTLGPIFSLVGTYLLILSYTKLHEIEHTMQKGNVAEGTVIELREDPGDLNVMTKVRAKAPVVDFYTINCCYRHHSTSYRHPSPYEVGQKVKIYYYFYKSRHEMALADDEPGTLPKTFLKWGIILSSIGYPILISKLAGLF